MNYGVVCWSFMHRKNLGLLPNAEDYLLQAKQLGFGGVELAIQMLPPAQDTQANRQLKKTADDLGLYIDVGAESLFRLYELIQNQRAGAIFEQAKLLGSSCMRSTLQPVGIRHSEKWDARTVEQRIDQTIEYIGVVSEAARKFDVSVAFENHIDFRNDEIVKIFNAVEAPNVGLLLDTANPMALMQEPAELCSALLSRVLLVHLKDGYAIETEEGANIIWCVPGEGMAGVPQLSAMLSSLKEKVHFNLELIVPQQWPVPFNTAEYWLILGVERCEGLEMMNKMRSSMAERKSAPPTEPDRLLAYEDEQLRKSVPALRTLFG